MGHVTVVGGCRAKAPSSGILASSLAVGTTVKLMENGVAAEYLVVNQGKPSGSSLYDDSCDGLWLLRKDLYEARAWHASIDNRYSESDIHAYLNNTFLGLFDTNAQSAIKQVKIPYGSGRGVATVNSGGNGVSAKVFLLSGYEVGFTTSDGAYATYLVEDGAKLSYFESGTSSTAKAKRIANLNGSANTWWTRTPVKINYAPNMIEADGSVSNRSAYDLHGIRPALVLPPTALFDEETMVLKGVT